jgi:hypothetical protein
MKAVILALALAFAPCAAFAQSPDEAALRITQDIGARATDGEGQAANAYQILSRYLHALNDQYITPIDLAALERAARARIAAAAPASAKTLLDDALSAMTALQVEGAAIVDTSAARDSESSACAPMQTERRMGAVWARVPAVCGVSEYDAGNTCVALRDVVDARPLVLDLRGNTGGAVDQIACIASLFVPERRARIFELRYRSDAEPRMTDARAAPGPRPARIVVLIDRETDSGGLLLAAILQDRAGAEIAGAVRQNIGDYGRVIVPLTGWSNPNELYVALVPNMRLHRADGRPLSEGFVVDMPIAGEEAAVTAAIAARLAL